MRGELSLVAMEVVLGDEKRGGVRGMRRGLVRGRMDQVWMMGGKGGTEKDTGPKGQGRKAFWKGEGLKIHSKDVGGGTEEV